MRPAMLPVDWAFCPAEVGVSDQAGSYQLISLKRTSIQNPSC